MRKKRHQRFRAAAIECLTSIGPASWVEMKEWIWANKKNACRIIPASGQVGGILASMPEIHQARGRRRVPMKHSMGTRDRGSYALWSLRGSDGTGY